MIDRRYFLTRLSVAALAPLLPKAATGDGVVLTSMAHPTGMPFADPPVMTSLLREASIEVYETTGLVFSKDGLRLKARRPIGDFWKDGEGNLNA